jgi:peptidyl-prolyl cis-trans isomerase C
MNRSTPFIRSTFSALAAFAVVSFAGPSWAQAPALAQGEKIAIGALDMRADAEQRIPPEARQGVLSQPSAVAQIATNLYTRRAMAEIAESEGLGKDPLVEAALKIARDKVLSDAYLAKLDQKNMPTDAVIEGYARNVYAAKPERFNAPERVQIRHILIAASDVKPLEKAERLLAQIKGGADFAQLAKDNSADRGSAAKGGDLGAFGRGQMVPEFEQAAFALKKAGDVSDIVKTQFGYHILQLTEILPPATLPYEQVRAELIREVRTKAVQEFRANDAQRLQEGMKINAEAVKAFASSYKP